MLKYNGGKSIHCWNLGMGEWLFISHKKIWDFIVNPCLSPRWTVSVKLAPVMPLHYATFHVPEKCCRFSFINILFSPLKSLTHWDHLYKSVNVYIIKNVFPSKNMGVHFIQIILDAWVCNLQLVGFNSEYALALGHYRKETDPFIDTYVCH